jgi:hypothetical protein
MEELQIPQELVNWKKVDWIGWIDKHLSTNVAYPTFPKISEHDDPLQNLFSLFAFRKFNFQEYHDALLEILLEKLNGKKSEENEQQTKRIRASLEVLHKLLC